MLLKFGPHNGNSSQSSFSVAKSTHQIKANANASRFRSFGRPDRMCLMPIIIIIIMLVHRHIGASQHRQSFTYEILVTSANPFEHSQFYVCQATGNSNNKTLEKTFFAQKKINDGISIYGNGRRRCACVCVCMGCEWFVRPELLDPIHIPIQIAYKRV